MPAGDPRLPWRIVIVLVVILFGVALLGLGALVVASRTLIERARDVKADSQLLATRLGELRDLTARIELPRGRGK